MGCCGSDQKKKAEYDRQREQEEERSSNSRPASSRQTPHKKVQSQQNSSSVVTSTSSESESAMSAAPRSGSQLGSALIAKMASTTSAESASSSSSLENEERRNERTVASASQEFGESSPSGTGSQETAPRDISGQSVAPGAEEQSTALPQRAPSESKSSVEGGEESSSTSASQTSDAPMPSAFDSQDLPNGPSQASQTSLSQAVDVAAPLPAPTSLISVPGPPPHEMENQGSLPKLPGASLTKVPSASNPPSGYEGVSGQSEASQSPDAPVPSAFDSQDLSNGPNVASQTSLSRPVDVAAPPPAPTSLISVPGPPLEMGNQSSLPKLPGVSLTKVPSEANQTFDAPQQPPTPEDASDKSQTEPNQLTCSELLPDAPNDAPEQAGPLKPLASLTTNMPPMLSPGESTGEGNLAVGTSQPSVFNGQDLPPTLVNSAAEQPAEAVPEQFVSAMAIKEVSELSPQLARTPSTATREMPKQASLPQFPGGASLTKVSSVNNPSTGPVSSEGSSGQDQASQPSDPLPQQPPPPMPSNNAVASDKSREEPTDSGLSPDAPTNVPQIPEQFVSALDMKVRLPSVVAAALSPTRAPSNIPEQTAANSGAQEQTSPLMPSAQMMENAVNLGIAKLQTFLNGQETSSNETREMPKLGSLLKLPETMMAKVANFGVSDLLPAFKLSLGGLGTSEASQQPVSAPLQPVSGGEETTPRAQDSLRELSTVEFGVPGILPEVASPAAPDQSSTVPSAVSQQALAAVPSPQEPPPPPSVSTAAPEQSAVAQEQTDQLKLPGLPMTNALNGLMNVAKWSPGGLASTVQQWSVPAAWSSGSSQTQMSPSPKPLSAGQVANGPTEASQASLSRPVAVAAAPPAPTFPNSVVEPPTAALCAQESLPTAQGSLREMSAVEFGAQWASATVLDPNSQVQGGAPANTPTNMPNGSTIQIAPQSTPGAQQEQPQLTPPSPSTSSLQ